MIIKAEHGVLVWLSKVKTSIKVYLKTHYARAEVFDDDDDDKPHDKIEHPYALIILTSFDDVRNEW